MSARSSLPRLSKGGRPSSGLSNMPLRVRPNEDNPRLSANRFSMELGTSGPRKSFLSKNTSLTVNAAGPMQKRRASSAYGRGYPRSDMKDPRPISDKPYQHRCIKELVEFLLDNVYPHQISTKILQSPQSRDFFRIFEFLYGHLYDPKYKLGKKPEEEIPALMKLMGYRFHISKSSLFTIGTAHTWPHLLAAIHWLMGASQICLQPAGTDIESLMFPLDGDNFDAMPIGKIQLQYTGKTYEAFMCGKDTYEEEDEEIIALLSQNLLGSAGDLETLESDNRRLTQELDMLQQNPDKVAELQGTLEGLLTDAQAYHKYLLELDTHKADQGKLFADLEDERQNLLTEQKSTQESNNEMQRIFETQEFSQADVDRIKHEGLEIKREISSVERETEKLDSDIWALEMGVGKSQERTEQKCHEYNKLAQFLKLIPSTAEYAKDKNLELKTSFTGQASNCNSAIKDAIMEVKQEFKERVNAKAQMRITVLESLDQGTELKCQKQEDVEMKESKLKRIEDDINCKKENFQRELASLMSDTEATQEELLQHRRSGLTNPEELAKEVSQDRKQCDQKKVQMEKTESEYATFLMNYTQVVLEHKQAITDQINKIHGEMRKTLEHVEQSGEKPLFP